MNADTDSPTVAEIITRPDDFLDRRQKAWSGPPVILGLVAKALLYAINWYLMRILFRLRVEGLGNIPKQAPIIFVPNHSSSLDPLALGAAISFSLLNRTRWAGWNQAVLRTPVHRIVNRLAGVIPIDRDLSALAVGVYVLRAEFNLIWFAEGTRSHTGEVRDFRPGIGILLQSEDVAAVPIYIEGAHAALPPGNWLPRFFRRITVRFGTPYRIDTAPNSVETLESRAQSHADALREELLKFGPNPSESATAIN